MLDVLIRNGRVVDGTGNAWFPADIGIRDGRIEAVGKLGDATAASTLDARGLVVCPGFVDLHTHSDITLLIDPAADSTVRQGITTAVVGNCGMGAAPVRDPRLIRSHAFGCSEEYGVDVNWRTMGDYLRRLEGQGIAVNVAALAAHGAIRIAAMGFATRPCTPAELEDMKSLLAQALDEGAVGLSSGLEYAPGQNAEPRELTELCKVVAARGGFYATHTRLRDGEQAIPAMREAADTAEQSGVALQLSHIQLRRFALRGTEQAVAIMDELRARGHDCTCDVVPLTWGHTTMAATLPPWAFEGGAAKTVERLRDPATRLPLREKPFYRLQSFGMWDQIMLLHAEHSPELAGKTFDEIARLRGLDDPWDAIFDILAAEGEDFKNVVWAGKNYLEEDAAMVMRHPASSIISDGVNLATYGPLGRVRWHPLSYGFTADVFENWVKRKKVISLEEAVRKLTSASAQRLGLRNRGLLREGMAADVVVFDPDNIRNHATYAEPRQYPTGIEYVLVNGQTVVERGKHLGKLSGQVLRRS